MQSHAGIWLQHMCPWDFTQWASLSYSTKSDAMADQLAPSALFKVCRGADHGEYEWNQTVEEVNLYVKCQAGISAKQVACKIASTHVTICIRGRDGETGEEKQLIDHDTVQTVKPGESFWTLDSKQGVISITLQKASEGQTWSGVFRGHAAIDPQLQDNEQKRLLLERFQLEHPGFDFSGAEVNGSCPDPSQFMGGFR